MWVISRWSMPLNRQKSSNSSPTQKIRPFIVNSTTDTSRGALKSTNNGRRKFIPWLIQCLRPIWKRHRPHPQHLSPNSNWTRPATDQLTPVPLLRTHERRSPAPCERTPRTRPDSILDLSVGCTAHASSQKGRHYAPLHRLPETEHNHDWRTSTSSVNSRLDRPHRQLSNFQHPWHCVGVLASCSRPRLYRKECLPNGGRSLRVARNAVWSQKRPRNVPANYSSTTRRVPRKRCRELSWRHRSAHARHPLSSNSPRKSS